MFSMNGLKPVSIEFLNEGIRKFVILEESPHRKPPADLTDYADFFKKNIICQISSICEVKINRVSVILKESQQHLQ